MQVWGANRQPVRTTLGEKMSQLCFRETAQYQFMKEFISIGGKAKFPSQNKFLIATEKLFTATGSYHLTSENFR